LAVVAGFGDQDRTAHGAGWAFLGWVWKGARLHQSRKACA
jgi:hypothetical protein